MGNGIYFDVETYTFELTPDERLFRDSREKLNYLKDAQRRLALMKRQHSHYLSNPLGGAMCKDLELRMYQQTLLANRNHRELIEMVESYNHKLESSEETTPSPQSQQSSLQANWEEVVEMAKKSVEDVYVHKPARSSSSSEPLFKSIYSVPTAMATASDDSRRSHKTFPPQTTPPIEEIVGLRESLKRIEQSPLFTTTPVFKPAPVPVLGIAATGLRSPSSLP